MSTTKIQIAKTTEEIIEVCCNLMNERPVNLQRKHMRRERYMIRNVIISAVYNKCPASMIADYFNIKVGTVHNKAKEIKKLIETNNGDLGKYYKFWTQYLWTKINR